MHVCVCLCVCMCSLHSQVGNHATEERRRRAGGCCPHVQVSAQLFFSCCCRVCTAVSPQGAAARCAPQHSAEAHFEVRAQRQSGGPSARRGGHGASAAMPEAAPGRSYSAAAAVAASAADQPHGCVRVVCTLCAVHPGPPLTLPPLNDRKKRAHPRRWRRGGRPQRHHFVVSGAAYCGPGRRVGA